MDGLVLFICWKKEGNVMVVKEYDNAQAFLNDNEAVLLENEAVSQLILYNANNNLEVTACKECLFGAVTEEDKALLLFCNVAPDNMVVYAINVNNENIDSAAIMLADFFGNNHIIIQGINARYDVSFNFMEQYKKYVNCNFVLKQQVDIMGISQINDIKLVEGLYRQAKPQEVKMLTDWMIQFQIEALASEMDYERALKKTECLINSGNMYIFENTEHEVVSMAAVTRKLVHGSAINYVFTPEQFRGEGYAVANIYYLSRQLLEDGNEYCTLFVDTKNTVSNKAYEKLGYKILEDNYEYKVIPVDMH
jgi:predicted GNAT family acetyltransferase